jgi:pimeloyl-ACP methyl ester carboxylesterase
MSSAILKPADLGPASRTFISQRLRLSHVDWGNARAPHLVLVHGSRDHCRSWDWTARALRKDWHVVAPDLRGHGDSAWSPEGRYDFTSFVYDLAQFVSQLGDPVVLVAHSLGAHIALRYAGLFPESVRGLIAIEPVGAPREIEAEYGDLSIGDRLRRWITDKQAAASRIPRRYPSVEEAFARMQAENPGLSEEQLRHLTFHGIARNEDGSWSWKFDNYLRLWPFIDLPYAEVIELWRAVRCPTLLMYGRQSWTSDLDDDLRRSLPHAATLDYEQGGHWLHHDCFDRFVADVRAFLATLDPAGISCSS